VGLSFCRCGVQKEAIGEMTLGKDAEPTVFLVVGVAARFCAVPLQHVVETMRPLPIEVTAGAPSFVRGLSIIRGTPVPVVDLRLLLGIPPEDGTRFVALRIGERRVALLVDEVVGIRRLDGSSLDQLPPLLRDARGGLVQELGTLDTQLLMVLRASHLLPDDTWQGAAVAS
jgi:purine-binding chemotaxis protein CheW